MTILAALVRAYDRLEEDGRAAPIGYSQEKIGFSLTLAPDGALVGWDDLRTPGKKAAPEMLRVPQAVKRASGVASNFLWDKTAYTLGVTAGEGKRTAVEHVAFVKRHLEALAQETDPGLVALRHFLENWRPEHFIAHAMPEAMKDQNIVFAFDPGARKDYIHERPAAKALWRRVAATGAGEIGRCLLTGEQAPIARLHPSIKNVWGAQTAGAALVSFNLDAFTSYGKEQGANASISQAAAAAYGEALNVLLRSDIGQRMQIGDASVVYWADASGPNARERIEKAEDAFDAAFNPPIVESAEAEKIKSKLEAISKGLDLAEIEPQLQEGVRFHVLALSPNAARLFVRFYVEDSLKEIGARYRRFLAEMKIEPPPRNPRPPLWRLLTETAVMGKRENVADNLSGEWMRAILTGKNYPQTLFATTLMRIRADKKVTELRAAILKSFLIRNLKEEAPVALDVEYRNRGYLLGRLFAVYERIQTSALGDLNATIKDKYFGAASSQPQRIFPMLEKGAAHHLSKLGKISIGGRINLEKDLASIVEIFSPSDDPYPVSLSNAEQALFALGYYHQRSRYFVSKNNSDQKDAD